MRSVFLLCFLVSWASAQYGSGSSQSQWNSGSFSQSNSGTLTLSSNDGSLSGGLDSSGRFIMAGYVMDAVKGTSESMCIYGSGTPGGSGQMPLYGVVAKGTESGGTFQANMWPTSVSSGYTSGELRDVQVTPGTPSGSVQTVCGSYTYSYYASPSTDGYGSSSTTGSGNGMPGTVNAGFSYSGSFGNWSVYASGSIMMGPDSSQNSAYSSISFTNSYSSPTGSSDYPTSFSGCLTRMNMDPNSGTFDVSGHIAGQPLYASGMMAGGMFATQSISYAFPTAESMSYLTGSYSNAGAGQDASSPVAYVNFYYGSSQSIYLNGAIYSNGTLMSSGTSSGTKFSGSVMPSGSGIDSGTFSISGMINFANFEGAGEYGNGCIYASYVTLSCGASTDYSAALTSSNGEYPSSSGMGIGCATVDATGSFTAAGAFSNFNGGVSTFDASGTLVASNGTDGNSPSSGSSMYTVTGATINVDGNPVNQEISIGYMSYGSVNGNVGPYTAPVASFYGSAMGNTVGLSQITVQETTGTGSGTAGAGRR